MAIEGLTEDDALESRFGGEGFVFFRLPDADTYTYVAQRDAPETFSDCAGLKDARGVVIAPFRISDETPILLIRPDYISSRPVPPAVCPAVPYSHDGPVRRCDYHDSFSACHEALRRGLVRKVVCSRRLKVGFPENALVNPVLLFREACRLNPHCYVSLWWTRRTGCWLVATPETLLSSDGGSWTTMALAGTMTAAEGSDPAAWNTKNKEEQRYVSAFIQNRLRDVVKETDISEAYPCRAGDLVHLRTDFRFVPKDGVHCADILDRLHPTPAVCGVPLDAARRLIDEAEPDGRRYYAGFSGMIGMDGGTHLYVSLRCMELQSGGALLYAGGGLLESSDEEEEWVETCRKLQPMLELFGKKRA